MSKTVQIEIRDGRVVRIEADGFVGHTCAGIVEGISQALGAEGLEEARKPEYDLREESQEIADGSL